MTDLSLYEVDLDTQRPNPSNNTQTLRGDAPRTAFQKYNDSLRALHSAIRHVGSLAPSPSFPYMLWLDTSTVPPTERIRNAANTAWLLQVNRLGLNIKGTFATVEELPAGATNGDTYIVGTHAWVWAGSAWVDTGEVVGPEGPVGPQGETGQTGASLVVLGQLADTDSLPDDAEAGNAYRVGDNLHVWNGTVWVDAGLFRGPQGDQGIPGQNGLNGVNGVDGRNGNDGQDGADGLSAYEVAVENGFTGTEAEWLESLKGEPGSGTGGGLGQFMFAVEGGNLILYYSEGETPPNFEIVDGELVYTF